MTQLTLSANTQNLINTAISKGRGTNNVNYLNAYNAIYSDLEANGHIDAGFCAQGLALKLTNAY
jgi:hypothetical protein